MNPELEKLKEEANKALTCLYIAVSESVARDVNEKVRAYIQALEDYVPHDGDTGW
jgi:hypothetical protein